jgi:hypothetical protein
VAALEDRSAWRGITPAGADAAAIIPAVDESDEDEDADVPVRPDAELEAVQTLAPLERALEHYGIYEITGPDRLAVTAVGVGAPSPTWDPVLDWFAPAQYDDMSRSEKLGAPSYEQMTGGVRFAAESVTFGAGTRSLTPSHEVRILDDGQSIVAASVTFSGTLVASLGRGPAVGARTVSSRRFTLGEPTFSLVDATTGAAAGATGTYHDAVVARRGALAADPAARGALRVAPTHAVMS